MICKWGRNYLVHTICKWDANEIRYSRRSHRDFFGIFRDFSGSSSVARLSLFISIFKWAPRQHFDKLNQLEANVGDVVDVVDVAEPNFPMPRTSGFNETPTPFARIAGFLQHFGISRRCSIANSLIQLYLNRNSSSWCQVWNSRISLLISTSCAETWLQKPIQSHLPRIWQEMGFSNLISLQIRAGAPETWLQKPIQSHLLRIWQEMGFSNLILLQIRAGPPETWLPNPTGWSLRGKFGSATQFLFSFQPAVQRLGCWNRFILFFREIDRKWGSATLFHFKSGRFPQRLGCRTPQGGI